MKNNRFLTVVAMISLILSLAGAGSMPAFAQSQTSAQTPTVTASGDTGNIGDGDNIDQQVGDQSTVDTGTVLTDTVEAGTVLTDTVKAGTVVTDTLEAGTVVTGTDEITSGPDTDNVQEGQGPQVEDGQPDQPGTAQESAGSAGQ